MSFKRSKKIGNSGPKGKNPTGPKGQKVYANGFAYETNLINGIAILFNDTTYEGDKPIDEKPIFKNKEQKDYLVARFIMDVTLNTNDPNPEIAYPKVKVPATDKLSQGGIYETGSVPGTGFSFDTTFERYIKLHDYCIYITGPCAAEITSVSVKGKAYYYFK